MTAIRGSEQSEQRNDQVLNCSCFDTCGPYNGHAETEKINNNEDNRAKIDSNKNNDVKLPSVFTTGLYPDEGKFTSQTVAAGAGENGDSQNCKCRKKSLTNYGLNQKEDEAKSRGNDEKEKLHSESFGQKILSCRWKLAYLCFFVRFITGAFRQSMSIAILSMTKENNASLPQATTNVTDVIQTHTTREFNWSTTFQGVVLSTFNAGSVLAPLLIGYLTRKMSERVLMVVCLAMGGTASMLLPPLSHFNEYTVIVMRALQGLSLAGTDNVIQSLWSSWAPTREMASLLSCAYAGIGVSGMLTYPLCGFLISLGDHESGWPNIYYAFGVFTLLLVPFWWTNAFDTPEQHPRIANSELQFITDDVVQFDKKKDGDIPWRRILTSRAVWAIFICFLSNKLVLSILLSFLPYYFHETMHVNVEKSGFLAALPNVGRFISGIAGGYLSDLMVTKGCSIVTTRKFFQTLACFGCASCAFVLVIAPDANTWASISLLVASVSFQNIASVGYRINLLDIAPGYAAFISGVIGTATNIISLPGPVVTSLLLSSDKDMGWPMVFCTVAIVNVAAGIVFMTCAAGEIQVWAKSDYVEIN